METQLVTDRLNDGIGQILYNLARKTALEPYGSHAFKGRRQKKKIGTFGWCPPQSGAPPPP